MQKQIQSLLHREMTRKEFLTAIGLAIVSMLGFTSMLQLLNGKQHGSNTTPAGYGSSNYGGVTK